MIFHRFSLGNMSTNCYIIADDTTKNAVLFDAPDEADKIEVYIEENSLKLKYVFLTHAHFDHIGALDDILKKYGAKLCLHEKELKYLNDDKLNLSCILPYTFNTFSVDMLFKDNDFFSLDGIKIKVIHTPGHTEGSACYLIDDILISGDTLFNRSIGRSDFPLGNYDDEINSIKEKLMLLDDSVKVYPGHGFSTDIGTERRENPYLR